MKKADRSIKKTIKRRIEISQQSTKMNERQRRRLTPNAPRPLPVELISRNERRIGKVLSRNTPIKFTENYVKKNDVDYDAIVIISSYNRYSKVNRLLSQLFEQQTKYTFKVVLLNDGSDDKHYLTLSKRHPELIYFENNINLGKKLYWESMTKLFQKASEYTSHAIIQIDDDFIICNNFIDKLMDEYFKSKEQDNKNVAIYHHIPKGLKELLKNVIRIDGGTLFDPEFLKLIEYNVPSVSSSISSGVWVYLTKKIKEYQLNTYKLNFSLSKHDGNDDSKMNWDERINSPIFTEDFIDLKND